MALGKLVKQAGFRQGYLEGMGEVRVRWQSGLGATVRGLYKNSFASMDFNLPFTLFSAGFTGVMNVLPFLLPFITQGWTRMAAAASLVMLMAVLAQTARSLGIRGSAALGIGGCAWFGGALLAWALVASAALTLSQGGVMWRGTLYPIELLRGRQVKL
jgi:hypothetical protein